MRRLQLFKRAKVAANFSFASLRPLQNRRRAFAAADERRRASGSLMRSDGRRATGGGGGNKRLIAAEAATTRPLEIVKLAIVLHLRVRRQRLHTHTWA